MKRDLNFIKDFRPTQGYSGELFDLLEDDLGNVPAKNGVYIIASNIQKFIYPWGESRIIYIGKADSLHRRLREHRKNLEDVVNGYSLNSWYCNRYNYMDRFGRKVYFYTCRGKQDAKDLESRIIRAFYQKFGAMPVGNGARSFQSQNND